MRQARRDRRLGRPPTRNDDAWSRACADPVAGRSGRQADRPADHQAGPALVEGSGPRPGRWLRSRTDHPAVAALIALLAAVAFALARWQIWAHGNIGRFILVGRHFATPARLPPGIPLAPTYGYDGQFFYRLALDPANLSRTAYGITMDRPYRYMRIGYPALTWLVSLGQHSLVPVALVAVNIAAIGAMAYFGAVFARQAGGTRWPGCCWPGISA